MKNLTFFELNTISGGSVSSVNCNEDYRTQHINIFAACAAKALECLSVDKSLKYATVNVEDLDMLEHLKLSLCMLNQNKCIMNNLKNKILNQHFFCKYHDDEKINKKN